MFLNSYASFASGPQMVVPAMRRLDYSHDVPPLGCNPDAMKLFVGNIPKSYTADSLRPLFEAIGTVVELVVVRDKLTDESKGSAFVWYQTRVEAERAIAELHLRRVLQDPTGEQDRPLVVRRANPKVPPVIFSSTMVQSQPGFGDTDLPAHLQGTSFLPQRNSMDSIHLSSQGHNSVNQMHLMEQFGSLGLNSTQQLSASAALQDTDFLGRLAAKNHNLNALLEQGNPSVLGQSAAPPVFPSLSTMPTVNHNNPRNNDLTSILQHTLNSSFSQSNNNMGCGGSFGQMSLALHVSRSHGSIMANNLHNIQGSTVKLRRFGSGAGYEIGISRRQ